MINQFILGAFVASVVGLVGFVLLYSHLIIRRERKRYAPPSPAANRIAERKDHQYIKTSVNNVDGPASANEKSVSDVIIVGAGVAGSALAYTLGKVPLVISLSVVFFATENRLITDLNLNRL